MDLNRIRELIKIVAESDVAEVEVEQDGMKVTVRRNTATVTVQQAFPPAYPMGYMPTPPIPAQAPSPVEYSAPPAPAPAPVPQPVASATAPEEGFVQKAPLVGTIYLAPSPEAPDFVSVGSQVKQGDVLCIIEAMKLMNEVEAEISGTIKRVLIQNAEAVEYDQPLFLIDPA